MLLIIKYEQFQMIYFPKEKLDWIEDSSYQKLPRYLIPSFFKWEIKGIELQLVRMEWSMFIFTSVRMGCKHECLIP